MAWRINRYFVNDHAVICHLNIHIYNYQFSLLSTLVQEASFAVGSGQRTDLNCPKSTKIWDCVRLGQLSFHHG